MPANTSAKDAGEKRKEREKESKIYYIRDDRARVKEQIETSKVGVNDEIKDLL